jgi:hypothetical protein
MSAKSVMKQVKKLDFKDPIVILLVAGLFLYFVNAIFIFRVSGSSSLSDVARSDTELWYCSEAGSPLCQDGVARLNYSVRTRRDHIIDTFRLSQQRELSIKLQKIDIRLQQSADLTLEGSDYFLYEDSNNNGLFEEHIDKKVARGQAKKKHLLFEDLNIQIGPFSGSTILEEKINFFVLNTERSLFKPVTEIDSAGEPVTKPLIKDIDVESINLARGNEIIQNRSSFADSSLYSHINEVDKTRDKFVADNPIFKAGASNEIIWPAGDYTIDETIIIPKGLRVTMEAGVNVQIAPSQSLFSYSPIDIKGTAKNPVNITNIPGQDNFATFAMVGRVNNPESVTINHVIVKNGSQDIINGAFASGMFSVYRYKKVTITNSEFHGSSSDDGLNIKYADVYLANSLLQDNSADAWDGDFVTGLAEKNLFIDNGNDSLDFSGSDLTIQFNHVINSGDKCASVGEGTKIGVQNNYFDGCNIGVEVKDRSNAVIRNNAILDSKTSGINAYIKKFFFGAPTLTYYDNILLNDKQIDGLAPKSDFSRNITTGNIKDLSTEVSWLKNILKQVPKP